MDHCDLLCKQSKLYSKQSKLQIRLRPTCYSASPNEETENTYFVKHTAVFVVVGVDHYLPDLIYFYFSNFLLIWFIKIFQLRQQLYKSQCLSVCRSVLNEFMEVLCCFQCTNVVTVIVVYSIRTFYSHILHFQLRQHL